MKTSTNTVLFEWKPGWTAFSAGTAAQGESLDAAVAHTARVIHSAFHPDKVNYGAYGGTTGQLHFHLVPKHKERAEWGGVFQMAPSK
ncbi:hypothetical protein [uncultured Dysosmobacter sp.]|uniref:hypothetical protein n=1 Tax=uncultured Dysosmobacter sp. TaxID=2591384 RepID=UPI00262C258D|nr:hypothetical protein [uncultured Dysosmobacter sp.]